MRHLLKIAAPLCTGLTMACSSGKNSNDNDSARFGGQDYLVLDGANLQATSDLISGQGRVLFKAPLGEVASSKNFLLRFSLSDAGTLALTSHADDNLQNGVSVVFSRAGSTLNLAVGDTGALSDAHALAGIDASGDVSVAVDIHNSEDPAHIVVWNGSEANPTEDNALYNSDEPQGHDEHGHDEDGHNHAADDHDHEHTDEVKGRGQGSFWGLNLNNAAVSAAAVRGALGGH